METKLVSYLGKKDLKKSLIKEIERHRKADEIVQGTYGDRKSVV